MTDTTKQRLDRLDIAWSLRTPATPDWQRQTSKCALCGALVATDSDSLNRHAQTTCIDPRD